MANRLGDILIRQGIISAAQLESAVAAQRLESGRLGVVLLRRGLISHQQLGDALAEQFGVPYRDALAQTINPQVMQLVPESLARKSQLVPLSARNRVMTLAMVSPDDLDSIAEVEMLTGYVVDPVVALENDIHTALDMGYDERIVARQTIVDIKLADLRATPDEAASDESANLESEVPVVRLVHSILVGAINANASDIHLEPHSPEMRVRYRVDGELQTVMTIPKHTEEVVVARIKVMADLDTTESRRPQDGHLMVADSSIKASMRVSTIPTVDGEKVVLRILDDGHKQFSLDQINLPARERQILNTMLYKPHGMIVVTGPTGSGKSTTMYAILSALNSPGRNIVTVEDPVEFRIPGINQVSADNEHGLGFANALKYFLRQDPDVIMVGEIRDRETAQTAVQAALTGHLLISTLHTNDAVGAVARLTDLGVDPFKIGGALLCSVAQRLLRVICPACKEPTEPHQGMLYALAGEHDLPKDATFFKGRGCKKCLGTGYHGRLAIFEIMPITPQIAEAIERSVPSTGLRKLAQETGMVALTQAGLQCALDGKTTLEEAYCKAIG